MTMLSHLHVEGFKSIRTLDLDLRSLNVLVGANGSGKSNLLAFFRLLNAIADRRLQLHAGVSGADSFLYFGRKTTPALTLRVTFDAQPNAAYPVSEYAATLIPTENDTLTFARESFSTAVDQAPDAARVSFIDSADIHPESLLAINGWQDQTAQRIQNALLGCKLYHFEDTSPTAKVKILGDIGNGGVLYEDASNLAAFLYGLREAQRPYYDRIVSVIRTAVPFFGDFVLEPHTSNPNLIRLYWRHINRAEPFSSYALSDGTLRFISLVALLLQPKLPPIIVLDEPELGLHPHAVWTLASLLKSAADQSQVIVAPQSVTLINQMDLENILVTERNGDESLFFWPDNNAYLRTVLEEYVLGEAWETNVFGAIQSSVYHPDREVSH